MSVESVEVDGWEAVADRDQEVEALERALAVKDAELETVKAELEEARRDLLEKEMVLGESQQLVKELKRRNSVLEALVPWLSSPIKEVIDLSSHRSVKPRAITRDRAHPNQARASARKHIRRWKREQAEQEEAAARGMTVAQLQVKRQAEGQGIIKEHKDDYGAGIGHRTSYWR